MGIRLLLPSSDDSVSYVSCNEDIVTERVNGRLDPLRAEVARVVLGSSRTEESCRIRSAVSAAIEHEPQPSADLLRFQESLKSGSRSKRNGSRPSWKIMACKDVRRS